MHPLKTHSPSLTHPHGRPTGRSRRKTPVASTMPEWSRAKPFLKLSEAYMVIEKMGGMLFTLNLRPRDHDVIVASKDPARTMSRRIQKAFRREGLPVPLLAFCLEVTTNGNRLHIHGAILVGDLDLRTVKYALRDAGGRIEGRAGSRQVQIKKFRRDRGGPEGWANYTKKAVRRTQRVIGHDRVTYIPLDLNRVCRPLWDQRRGQRVGYHIPRPRRS